jgi:hypothetical protein
MLTLSCRVAYDAGVKRCWLISFGTRPGRQSLEPATSVICSHSRARFPTCIARGGETDYKLPPSVPWLDDPSGYEDWATIDGSCALETLNEQAVSGRMAALHGTVAQ